MQHARQTHGQTERGARCLLSVWKFLALGGSSGDWHDGYIEDKQPRAEGWQGVEGGWGKWLTNFGYGVEVGICILSGPMSASLFVPNQTLRLKVGTQSWGGLGLCTQLETEEEDVTGTERDCPWALPSAPGPDFLLATWL